MLKTVCQRCLDVTIFVVYLLFWTYQQIFEFNITVILFCSMYTVCRMHKFLYAPYYWWQISHIFNIFLHLSCLEKEGKNMLVQNWTEYRIAVFKRCFFFFSQYDNWLAFAEKKHVHSWASYRKNEQNNFQQKSFV